ncbi:hypothetical protein Tcan_16891 [Toxocara canis]|uniref:SAM domain-containing protein n=1 Tax=Toxocara canis TaxID=6265 RepID=A0A0B2ULR0_TOXCA|nr:hypothetical protein Tcan_16891 [Toxocara canis]
MASGMLGKNRGGLAFRPYSGRPNLTSYPPPNTYCRQPRYELSSSFYHGTQKNAKVYEMMFRLSEVAYKQMRRSGAAMLRQKKQEEKIKFLERYPMSSDVSLNVEVPFEDHFDIISHTDAWCQGDSIGRIMNDTGVLILFPYERVDTGDPFEHVNTDQFSKQILQVKLKGPVAKVEEARRRLRNLCPVSITIPLYNLKANLTIDGARQLIGEAIADKRIDFPHIEITVIRQLPDTFETIDGARQLIGEAIADKRIDFPHIEITVIRQLPDTFETIDGARQLIGEAIADKRIDFPHIEITVIRQLPDTFEGHGWACVVRGSLCWEEEIHDACIALRYLLFDANDEKERSEHGEYNRSSLDLEPKPEPGRQLCRQGVEPVHLAAGMYSRFPSVAEFGAGSSQFIGGMVKSYVVSGDASSTTPSTNSSIYSTASSSVVPSSADSSSSRTLALLPSSGQPAGISTIVPPNTVSNQLANSANFTFAKDPMSFYASQVDVPLSQQLSVLGAKDAFLVRVVSNKTGALVCYPNPGRVTVEGEPITMLYLRGPVRSILHARRYIQGLLPVQLSFDVEDEDLIESVDREQRGFTKRDDVFGVNITIKGSRIEGEQLTREDFVRHLILIESGEFNLTNVYATRRALFRAGVLNEPTVTSNDYNFFDPVVKELISTNNKILFEGRRDSGNNSQADIPSVVCVQVHPANVASSSVSSWRTASGGNVALPWPYPSVPLSNNTGIYRIQSCSSKEELSIPVAQLVDSFRANSDEMRCCIPRCINPTAQFAAPYVRQANMMPVSGINVQQQSACTSQAIDLKKCTAAPTSAFAESERLRSTEGANMMPVSGINVQQQSACTSQAIDLKKCTAAPTSAFAESERLRSTEGVRCSELITSGTGGSLRNLDSAEAPTARLGIPSAPVSPTPLGSRPCSRNSNDVMNASRNGHSFTTEAVAVAMLKNATSQWLNSSHPISSHKQSESLPNCVQSEAVCNRFHFPRFNQRPPTTVQNGGFALGKTNYGRCFPGARSNDEFRFTVKRTLPLKPNFSGERMINEDSALTDQTNSQGNFQKGNAEFSSDVRLSPGGTSSRARVGDFRTASFNSNAGSPQRMRESRFSRDFRNEPPRDYRGGPPSSRDYNRSDQQRESRREFRGYRNDSQEFGHESRASSRNESRETGSEPHTFRGGPPRDVESERRDFRDGQPDFRKEQALEFGNDFRNRPFGRHPLSRDRFPLSHQTFRRENGPQWGGFFRRDVPPPFFDTYAARRGNYSRVDHDISSSNIVQDQSRVQTVKPTFPYSRGGMHRTPREESPRGGDSSQGLCSSRNSMSSSTPAHSRGRFFGSRFGESAGSPTATSRDARPFAQSFPPRSSNSVMFSPARNDRTDVPQQAFYEQYPPVKVDETGLEKKPVAIGGCAKPTNEEQQEMTSSDHKAMAGDASSSRDEEDQEGRSQTATATSSSTTATTIATTYAEIAKHIDVVKAAVSVLTDENGQVGISKEVTRGSLQTMEMIRKCSERTERSKSYAEMAKKSVERFDAVSPPAGPQNFPGSPNSRSSGSEKESMKEKVEWTLSNFDSVGKVLSHIGCQHLISLFGTRNIQIQEFILLSEEELMKLGITSSNERSRIHRAILSPSFYFLRFTMPWVFYLMLLFKITVILMKLSILIDEVVL